MNEDMSWVPGFQPTGHPLEEETTLVVSLDPALKCWSTQGAAWQHAALSVVCTIVQQK
jgi:hypothetical protein